MRLALADFDSQIATRIEAPFAALASDAEASDSASKLPRAHAGGIESAAERSERRESTSSQREWLEKQMSAGRR